MSLTKVQIKEIVSYAAAIIYANEGSYGSVNKDDNGAVSIGKVQWHGNRALGLLKTICSADAAQSKSILSNAFFNEIVSAASSAWIKRTVNATEATAISALLITTEGRLAQDNLADADITTYINKGISYGLSNYGALIYFADGVNQYGTASALWKNIAEKALAGAGDVTAMFAATKALTTNYIARRSKVYDAVLALNLKLVDNKQEANNLESIRINVVSIAQSFYGCKESDGSHKKIIDIYNTDKPLARGYTMKYTDAWCACFVSTVAIKAGLTDIMPKEVSCNNMIELYRKIGRWEEKDSYIPKTGDIIFYDWEDTSIGDNTGASDHVGIVVSVSGSSIKVIEGNMSNAVGYRNIAVNGKCIRGYGLPDYASKATNTVTSNAPLTIPNAANKQNTTTASDKISSYTVNKGDTLWAIASRFLGNGARYKEIMSLNGLKTDVTQPGQVFKIPAK